MGVESLIEQEEKHPPIKNEEDEFIWDEKDIALSLIDIEPDAEKVNPKENAYIWNDLETLKLLLLTKDDEEPELKTKKELFPWEDPDYIKLLFSYEDQVDLISFSDENESICEDSEKCNSKINHSINMLQSENESLDWLNWPFWNEFGPAFDIMKAYDDTYNVENKRYVDIKMSKNSKVKNWTLTRPGKVKQAKQTQKDPANIFKSCKHVFTIPNDYTQVAHRKVEDTILYEDMEDIYADWSLIALSDERTEKKRQLRGRKKQRSNGGPNKENEPKQGLGCRRPGTPTIQTVTKASSNKNYDFESSWIETKVPKKERKTAHVWKNARSQKRLNAKIFAKTAKISY